MPPPPPPPPQRPLATPLPPTPTPTPTSASASADALSTSAETSTDRSAADSAHISQRPRQVDVCRTAVHQMSGHQRRSRDASSGTADQVEKHDEQKSEVPEFCIDAGSAGNIARFINHSCEPNLFVQCVLSSHQDIKLARVVLFAADNIPPLQELTYDYGYALDSVFGPDGKVKRMPCYCGAADCTKRLF
ncbi:histone-lysine N-methyltransferase, H3 lysine-9 specific SUVH4-like [Eucalyptus grandis]|uniref:histone-lysine N-methyltransferase, H3 lysine-9 specific SUVH4-like n=1 Tax=Eucalyptus grandis TaxID=71139 RepID=UPI00192E76EC|nr:histone-lysine N-methyltransferase, H3 lysine-9 specific SUVH4-like [Eucalyptus grandis]